MKNLKNKLLVITLGLPLLTYVVLEIKNSVYFFQNQRAPVKYVLPDGFKGWVLIEYLETCAPAAQKGRYLEFQMNAEGKLCTSTPRPEGFAQDWVVYDGRRGQNLLKHPGTKMNFVWFDHERHEVLFETEKFHFFVFYVGYEVPKAKEKQVFEELKTKILHHMGT